MPKDAAILRPINYKEKPKHSGRRHERNKFYNLSVWRKTSIAYRSQHPLCECERCIKSDYPLPSQEVDHINPINPVDAFNTMNGQYGEPLDYDNLQALNKKCHARKSGKERHN